MTTQTIFKGFGPNWKWASISSTGSAWVHSIDPVLSNGGLIGNGDRFRGLETSMHCGAFDTLVTPDGKAYSWERTDFTNGPSYATDRFGCPLPAEELPTLPAAPTMQDLPVYRHASWCPEKCAASECSCQFAPASYSPMAPTAVVHITTDEAENGELWKFAKAHEQHVMVNCFGVVWFDVSKDGGQPRRETAVMVVGVVHPIERTRSLPVPVSPPEAGVPYVDKFDVPAPVMPRIYPSAPETVTVMHRGAITQYGDHTFVWYDESEQVAGAASTHVEAKRQLNAYYGKVNGDTPDHTYSEAQFAKLGAKIQEVEEQLREAKRKLDQIGQRVEFLVEHDHFDHATGLMILTGLPE